MIRANRFARIALRIARATKGPPNPGKTGISERTSRADVHEKNFGVKNFGLIFRSLKGGGGTATQHSKSRALKRFWEGFTVKC